MSNVFFYFILIIYSISVYSDEEIFFNRNNFKNLCKKLENFKERRQKLKTLNAYDRAEEKIRINSEEKKFLNSYFIVHLNSNEFKLSDYDFSNSNFKIENIKLKSGLEIKTDKDIFLNVKKENAKMIAAKKKLGILDLYLKIKLRNLNKSYDDYCNKRKKIIEIQPKVYEYFFMCTRSNNVIDYELLYEDKEKFISSPFIELKNKKEVDKINENLSNIENGIYKCKNKYKGYGTKIYQIKIDLDGDKILNNNGSSFKNKKLETCIDKEILKESFPKVNKEYSIYFSIVISNIK